MAGNPTTFKQKPRIKNGSTAQTDLKLADYMPVQHEDINSGVMTVNHISVAQSLCQPVASTPNSTPSGGAYTATCSNYPDFSLTYLDKDGNSHYLIGMKVRVIFTTGITYGSVSGGTYPTLNINGSGAIPLLAQGKTMASGACSSGQSLEFTLIPYGNGVAWDADSNVRESTSDYTIYTDGAIEYTKTKVDNLISPLQLKRIGEIYYKTGYSKISQVGYYSRPLVYLVVTSSGGCDILMFGVASTAKRISLGNTSTAIQYKYKAPSSNGENGYLFIYTSNSILDTIVYNLGTYGDTNGTLSNSDSTEYNSGSAF